MEPTYDRSNDEIQWGDEIPFDGSVKPSGVLMPAANAAYLWLLESGVSSVEARARVWGGYARPLVAQIRWRQAFSNTYDADDGCNPAVAAPAWEPQPETMTIMREIMGW